MIRVTCKAALNRAVANALHPEPPLSERRAIHESGCWRWDNQHSPQCLYSWEPADFCTDPVSSKLLRDNLNRMGFGISISQSLYVMDYDWSAQLVDKRGKSYIATHSEFETAICLAALRALNVEFELVDGWVKGKNDRI